MGFVAFDHPYLIWSPHITQRIIPYINLSQRVYVFSSELPCYSPLEKTVNMIKTDLWWSILHLSYKSLTRSIENLILIRLNEQEKTSSILVNPHILFLESVLMLELYMQILIIPSVLQLMILLMNFKMQTWYHNDFQTLVHAFYPKLTKENTHSCMSRKPSKPL